MNIAMLIPFLFEKARFILLRKRLFITGKTRIPASLTEYAMD
jgi:hypothetical protein